MQQTVHCPVTWVIPSQSPIAISLISFQRHVAKETKRIDFDWDLRLKK